MPEATLYRVEGILCAMAAYGAGKTSWVEVSRGALQANFEAVSTHAGTAVCAVVKSNAYGSGLVECARIFHHAGARMVAVTRVEEARELRDAGVTADILVLAPPLREALGLAITMDCALVLSDGGDVEPYAAAAKAVGRRARVHLKIDTGMGRLGVRPEHAPGIASRVALSDNLSLEGVWTHFADAGGPTGRQQLDTFLGVRSILHHYAPRAIMHVANSAGTIALPDARLDMVRVGTLLYGQDPVGAHAPFALRDPFTWLAAVVSVRELPAGQPVGYGGEWRAKVPTRVATLPIGYADGFGLQPAARSESISEAARIGARVAAVALGGRPSPRFVWFGERKAPVVGRIAMQEVTVRVDGIAGVEPGSIARIPARRLLVGAGIERVYVP
ncbi:MAG: alanine racemase [Pseudonocardiaceae bacterium]